MASQRGSAPRAADRRRRQRRDDGREHVRDGDAEDERQHHRAEDDEDDEDEEAEAPQAREAAQPQDQRRARRGRRVGHAAACAGPLISRGSRTSMLPRGAALSIAPCTAPRSISPTIDPRGFFWNTGTGSPVAPASLAAPSSASSRLPSSSMRWCASASLPGQDAPVGQRPQRLLGDLARRRTRRRGTARRRRRRSSGRTCARCRVIARSGEPESFSAPDLMVSTSTRASAMRPCTCGNSLMTPIDPVMVPGDA